MTPDPSPQPPYRKLLRWMEGAPTWPELFGMGALFLGVLALLLIARSLFRNYWRSQVHGLYDSPGRILAQSLGCVAAAGVLLWWLWVLLEGVATRMGITALGLLVLLANELRPGGRRRRSVSGTLLTHADARSCRDPHRPAMPVTLSGRGWGLALVFLQAASSSAGVAWYAWKAPAFGVGACLLGLGVDGAEVDT